MQETLAKLADLISQTSAVGVFLTIAGVSFIALVIQLVAGHFGAEHDAGHIEHPDHDHDMGNGTVSIFSTKVVLTFTMCFGSSGAIACFCGVRGWALQSLSGLVGGLLFGAAAYFILNALYKQQANSLVSTAGAMNQNGKLVTSIVGGGYGEVEVNISGSSRVYTASSKGGKDISRGSVVRVTAINGSILTVEEVA